ncbi:ATP-dependent DNA helicase [Sinorhizobium meliloti]|uniref:ATP-dependent DNA helicase n=1 Tax=Rhizobium meliloti TaxID=382 RepID=UPI001F18031E|nr:ATP-dependent RecD-like DNA helicase [Sinorhizobium meliloti]
MAPQPDLEDWGLSVGSKIMWLKNDYSKAPQLDADGNPLLDKATGVPICSGFMNGSLGVVAKSHSKAAWVKFDDGAEDAITMADLEKLTHGWAISVHKAQGSAFRRLIVPLVGPKLLDRALLYTAITRAVETVVIVGDPAVLRRTIEEPSKALDRGSSMGFSDL